jgi:hypothetical protein
MNRPLAPAVGSYEEAVLFRLRTALALTYAQRLKDLQDMLEFNAAAEARNPRLRQLSERLRRMNE